MTKEFNERQQQISLYIEYNISWRCLVIKNMYFSIIDILGSYQNIMESLVMGSLISYYWPSKHGGNSFVNQLYVKSALPYSIELLFFVQLHLGFSCIWDYIWILNKLIWLSLPWYHNILMKVTHFIHALMLIVII